MELEVPDSQEEAEKPVEPEAVDRDGDWEWDDSLLMLYIWFGGNSCDYFVYRLPVCWTLEFTTFDAREYRSETGEAYVDRPAPEEAEAGDGAG